MATDKKAIDVGHDIADLLLAWRPNRRGSSEDVALAIMYALERYSIEVEGPGETLLRGSLVELRDGIDRRLMAI